MDKRRIILKGIMITWSVMRKQTTQRKQVHFTLSCSRSGKSWNLGLSLGRLWKMTLIVQNNLAPVVRKPIKLTPD